MAPERVIGEMSHVGAERAANRTVPEVLILSTLAGAFITIGALFSVLLATGTETQGLKLLLEGFGFSVGFFVVILTGLLLFTEVNVELPATLLNRDPVTIGSRVARLWFLAAAGNLLGAFITGLAVNTAQQYSTEFESQLREIVEIKLAYRDIGGAEGFFRAVLSGMLGNWLVGMAAFLAAMGRTIIGKYIPVFLVVTAFVASGFLHSPANMAFFSLAEPAGLGEGWSTALGWGILPAAIGNVLGAFFLVALPFWFLNDRGTGERCKPEEPSAQ